jgi:hypothetical protein
MRYAFLIGFGGIGLACAIGGAIWAKGRLELQSSGLRAEGTVTGHDTHVSSSSGSNGRSRNTTMYAENVEFTDADGNKIQFTSDTSSSKPAFGVGEKVEVIYPKANPGRAVIHSFSSFWLGPIILTCFGLIFFAGGVFAFRQIGSMDKSFEKAFFMHRKKNRGRFQQTVTDVRIHDQDGKIAVGLTLRGKDPRSGSYLEWVTPSVQYTYNKVAMDRSAADQLHRRTFLLTYDPDNTSDYYFDIFQRGAARVA